MQTKKEELYERMDQIEKRGPFFEKDLEKAKSANKFIGRGSPKSSTRRYALAAGDLANCGEYTNADVVLISAEGQRSGRLDPDFNEISRAIDARVTFICDNRYDRERPYNVGERAVAAYLKKHGYTQQDNRWTPKANHREVTEEEI